MGIRRGTRRVTRVPAYAFTPKSISGLVAWYRADLGLTIATGVSAWADQSGTGDANKNLAQATGSAQPTRNVTDAAYNNKPTLSFSGAQWLRSGVWASPLAQPDTIFIVGNLTTPGASQQRFLDGLTVNAQVMMYDNTSGKLSIYAGALLLDAVVAVTTPRIFGATFNNTTSALYDTAVTAAASGTVGSANDLAGITLGIGGDQVSGPFTGKIAEVIAYSAPPSTSDRSNLMHYLGARYGIAVGA